MRHSRWIFPLFLCVALILLGPLPVPPTAHAATYVVDRFDDTNAVAAQACTAAANDCSLRGAITKANNTPGADVITLPAGTYTITITGSNELSNIDGDFDVRDDLTINGAGVGTTIIDAGGEESTFDLRNNAVFSVNNLTITDSDPAGNGHGIANNGTGKVSINNCTITDMKGYGIYNAFGVDIEIGNCTISNNTMSGVHMNTGSATITITGSTISNNGVNGIYNTGAITVTNSTISDIGGSGIYTTGAITVTNSTISNTARGINSPSGTGIVTVDGSTIDISGDYGIYNTGNIQVTNSTISNSGKSAAFSPAGNVTVSGSTIESNATGGVDSNTGDVTVTNSTVINNPSVSIYSLSGVVTVTGNIISGNYRGVLADNAGSVVTGNCITGNTTGAYDNGGGAVMNFTNNWWGAADGPGAPDGTGSGDPVNGSNISFTPWATAPIGPCALPVAAEEASGPAWGDPFPCDAMTFVGGWGIFSEGTPAGTAFTVPEPPAGYSYAVQPDYAGWCDVFTVNDDHSSLPVTACWPGSASMVGLHYDMPDLSRAWAVIPTTQQGANVCASLPHFGQVALLSGGAPAGTMATGETATTAAPVLAQPQANPVSCEVTTTNRLNFRQTPGGEIVSRVPYDTTLNAMAQSGDWYQVEWLGMQGWVSADYATAVCE